MAEVLPPAFMQARSDHSAETMRLLTAAFMGENNIGGGLNGRGGVHPGIGNRMAVTQTGSPTMAVIVRSGGIFLAGTEGATQGLYFCENNADKTMSVAAAPGAGLSRIDIVQARVRDSQYSGGLNDWILEVKTGTAASSPVAPNNDANGLTIAIINVGPSVPSINNGNIVWFAPYAHALGGYLEANNAFYFPPVGTVRPGQRAHRIDTDVSYIYNATDNLWDPVPVVRQGAYTPSLPSGFNMGATGTRTGQYKLMPSIRMAFFSANFYFNGAGSVVPAGPTFSVDLPPGIPSAEMCSGAGNFDWSNRGLVWRGLNGSSTVLVKTADSNALTTGFAPSPSYLHVGGWYQY